MKKYVKSDYDVTLPEDMIYAPDGDANTLRNFFTRRAEEDKAKKAKAAQQSEIDELKAKYPEDTIRAAALEDEPLEALFSMAVPPSGQCDSVGGEIVRAMMKILYRDYNDGDVFYEGYGRETCLPAVAYLIDVEPYAGIFEEFDYIAEDQLTDESYTDGINQIAENICEWLTGDRMDLFWTPNTRNYLDTPTDAYEFEAWDPEYDYEGDFPEELVAAIDRGLVDTTELERDLTWTLEGENIKFDSVSIGEYGYTVYSTNRDGLDYLEEIGQSIGEGLAESFVPEDFDMYEDEEDYDEYDEDEDEAGVWSATQVTAASATTQHLEVTKAWDDLFWRDANFKEWALRRDEDYSEGYDFIDDDTEVYCQAQVTDIRYNPKYDFLLLDITFTTGRFEDGEFIEETAGIESYKFPITRKVEKLLGE